VLIYYRNNKNLPSLEDLEGFLHCLDEIFFVLNRDFTPKPPLDTSLDEVKKRGFLDCAILHYRCYIALPKSPQPLSPSGLSPQGKEKGKKFLGI